VRPTLGAWLGFRGFSLPRPLVFGGSEAQVDPLINALVAPHYIQGNEACVEPQSLKVIHCGVFLGGVMGALKYVIVGVVVVVVIAAALTLLPTLHRVPVQYVGSPSGYEAFVPSGQTINYNGHTDPTGTLILSNGNTIQNAVWDGKYAGTIIQNHNQIVQLNNQFVGQTDPVNNQPYVPLQDFYVIKVRYQFNR